MAFISGHRLQKEGGSWNQQPALLDGSTEEDLSSLDESLKVCGVITAESLPV